MDHETTIQIDKLTKQKMEYTDDDPPRCRDCKHSETGENQGGLDYWICKLNPAVTLSVAEFGRCKFHEPKKPCANPPSSAANWFLDAVDILRAKNPSLFPNVQ